MIHRFAWAAATLGLALSLSAAERRISIKPDKLEAARYSRIEFTIDTPTLAANPYDPDEIDLRLEITSPSGKKLILPAFYFQQFDRQGPRGGGNDQWFYPTGAPAWKARFAPTEIGKYTCAAVLKDRDGAARSETISFACKPGTSKGFIRVSTKDPRYLEYDDGTPFFAIGQDTAFIHNSDRIAGMIRKLGANGANFARVWACCEDWAAAVEARKSAWGRSWDWNPPFAAMPDREGFHAPELCIKIDAETGGRASINPTRRIALRPNTKYKFSGQIRGTATLAFDLAGPRTISTSRQWKPFAVEFTTGADQWWLLGPSFRLADKGTIWLRSLSLKESAGGAELLSEADPNRPVLGVYNQLDCAMLDQIVEAAEQSGMHLQLVMLTRDHYMWMLSKENTRQYDQAIAFGQRLARYFAARWGYSTSVASWEYFNEMNPGLPTDRFYSEMGSALEQWDINHHWRATSTWSPPTKDCRHPKLETVDIHYYIRPATRELYKDEVASVLAQWTMMQKRYQNKPLMFAEFGITDDNWQRSRLLDNDKQFTHLHNALWTSALAGFASTTCHWYWDDIERRNLYPLYKPISKFTADIPWTTAHLRPAAATADKNLRTVGLQGDNSAYLWIADPQATWWKLAMENVELKQIDAATLTIRDLPPATYRVQWWDTQTGTVIKEDSVKSNAQELRLTVPSFKSDIACKAVR